MKSVYVETSIISYLASRPSRDLRVAAWQQITAQWWDQERGKYELFTSALVTAEAALGDKDAVKARIERLKGIPELVIDEESRNLAVRLIQGRGVPSDAPADALHIAVACVHAVDYLLTWNCRHIDNAITKPIVRSICTEAGYSCPEICTPFELLSEGSEDVPR